MEDNSSSDDDLQPASQTEWGMYETIKETYGHLTKDVFKQQMSTRFSEDDLVIYRTGVYAVSMEKIPDTPEGILVTRKDTANSGGTSALIKLAEDIYNLYHYVEGDTGFDITKLFTGKSKTIARSNTQRSIVEHLTMDKKGDEDSDVSSALQNLCVGIIQEMRQDRDIIQVSLTEVKKNTAQIQQVQKDVEQMRKYWHDDMMRMEHRMSVLETKVCQKPSSDSQDASNVDHVKEIRRMYADNLDRINTLDLNLAKLNKKCDNVEEHGYRLTVLHAKMDSLITNNDRQTDTRGPNPPIAATSKTDTDNLSVNGHRQYRQRSVCAPETRSTNKVDSRGHGRTDDENTTDRPGTLSVTIPSKEDAQNSSERSTIYVDPSDLAPVSGNTDDLTGFTAVRGRPRYIPMFVSGIMVLNEGIDETLSRVSKYLKKRECVVKNIRKVKTDDIIVSVKMMTEQNDVDTILEEGFWPKGIYCRKWRN